MIARQTLGELVDALPESNLEVAERYLKHLLGTGTDPVFEAFMNAPVDDEPLTPEEEAAIREGQEELACGEGIPLDEALGCVRQMG